MKLPDIPCDCCKSAPCSQWFGRTSVVICDNPECYDEMLRRYEEGRESDERRRQYEEEVEGVT